MNADLFKENDVLKHRQYSLFETQSNFLLCVVTVASGKIKEKKENYRRKIRLVTMIMSLVITAKQFRCLN